MFVVLLIVDPHSQELSPPAISGRFKTGKAESPAGKPRKKHLLSGLIKCSTCGSNYTISGNEIDRERITRNRLAVIETELENLSANMLPGLLSPTLMKMLSDREAEKAELETRLSRTAPAKPIAQIVPHPELLQKFKEKIGALRDTLNDERIRTEAAELMDRLIESVTIHPEGAHGPEAEIVAKVADLAAFAINDNAAPWGGAMRSMSLVAGERFALKLHFLRRR